MNTYDLECYLLAGLIRYPELCLQLDLQAGELSTPETREAYAFLIGEFLAGQQLSFAVLQEHMRTTQLKMPPLMRLPAINQTEVKALGELLTKRLRWQRLVTELHRLTAQQPTDLNARIGEMIAALLNSNTTSALPHTPAEISALVDEQLRAEETGANIIPTGLRWLSECIGGGWRTGRLLTIVGAYKQRKTTLALHFLLAAAEAAFPAAFYALEDNREDLYRSLWVLLATRHLYQTLPLAQATQEAQLSVDGLCRLRSATQQEALATVRTKLDKLPCLLVDNKERIADLERLLLSLHRDARLHRLRFVIIDNLQLIMAGGKTMFENIERAVQQLRIFCAQTGIVVCIISQKREAELDADHVSAGVRGGGALPAAADYLITTHYDHKRPELLTIALKYARRAQAGSRLYVINPSSGLILGEASDER